MDADGSPGRRVLVGVAVSDRRINLCHVSAYRWVLHDEKGDDLRATQTFDSKEEAEAWMATEWSALADEGAESVVLMEGGRPVYEMGLGAG